MPDAVGDHKAMPSTSDHVGTRSRHPMNSAANADNKPALDFLGRLEGRAADFTLYGHRQPWRRPVAEARQLA